MTPDREPLSRVVQLRLTDRQYDALALEADESQVRHTDVLRAAIVSYLRTVQPDFVTEEDLHVALTDAGYSSPVDP